MKQHDYLDEVRNFYCALAEVSEQFYHYDFEKNHLTLDELMADRDTTVVQGVLDVVEYRNNSDVGFKD